MSKRARLFYNGGSQAVRLPKECRFDGDEVLVEKLGESVILRPVEGRWARAVRELPTIDEETAETMRKVVAGNRRRRGPKKEFGL